MELFHVMNRVIEGRQLFCDSQDYARFVHDMYEFNTTASQRNVARRFVLNQHGQDRKKLVDIHAWCLMKDHYHLVVSSRSKNGAALFMRKLNVGYAKYYNERYGRSGFVFRGKTKKVSIRNHNHFTYILHYVHLNPLDYVAGASDWRIRSKGRIRSVPEAQKFLTLYRWSSYLDYIGVKNFPSLLTTKLFVEDPGSYAQSIQEYLVDTQAEILSGLE